MAMEKTKKRIRFTKGQMRALIALHLVVAVMLVGIILIPGVTDTPIIGPPPPPPHNRFRAANTLTLNDHISWEINLGGSGEETVHSFFQTANGDLFVVGTTNSTDYDFEGNEFVSADSPVSTFVVRLSRNGQPLNYAFVEGEVVETLKPGDNSLMLFQRRHLSNETHIHTLSLVNLSETSEARVLNIAPLTNAAIIRVDYIDDTPPGVPHQFRLFFRIQDTLGRVSFSAIHFNSDLTQRIGGIVEMPHAMSQTMVDIMCFGHFGFFVLTNVSDDMRRNAVGHFWTNLDGRVTRNLELGGAIQNRRYQARGMTISRHNNRFAILGTLDTAPSQTHIFEFNFDLVHQVTHAESMAGLANAVFPTHNGYVVTTETATSFSTYFLDYRFGDKRALGVLDSVSNISNIMTLRGGNDLLISGEQNNRPSLSIARGGNFGNFSSISIGSSSERIVHVRSDGLNQNYIFVAATSRGVSQDVGANFGLSDVWLVRVRV